jgi:hypothetical protein
MSFEPNDMNTIHPGNYEEFFILYMDNELNEEQVKMVDEFLTAHPDLKAEFEILMSTKLPMEDVSFDKKELFAENMKLSSVDEELLLYIDNELPADQKKTVELELASNKDYQLQLKALLQTKLDPSELVAYPDKKELYRHTERVVVFKPWMRVAAAVIIIAITGILYFRNSSSTIQTGGIDPTAFEKKPIQKNESKTITNPPNAINPVPDQTSEDQIAANSVRNTEKKSNETIAVPKEMREENPVQQEVVIAQAERPKVNNVPFNENEKVIAAIDNHKDILNIGSVTSPLLTRNTTETPVEEEQTAGNNRKGSIKGFLRKATRMIEKRTGIDPTNENGELLIGAVAINLK